MNTPQGVHRNPCPGDGCDLLAGSIIDDEPTPGQARVELSRLAVAREQMNRCHFLERDQLVRCEFIWM